MLRSFLLLVILTATAAAQQSNPIKKAAACVFRDISPASASSEAAPVVKIRSQLSSSTATYQVAVADCGCHDNRMDRIWWNEAWIGWPVGPEYADNSNVTHEGRLKGKLLLTVGELDKNVDPASTMQVVNALIKADKDFDLVVMTGAGHGSGSSPYGRLRREDFFIRHLQGGVRSLP